jgi:hypothetical protein
MTPLREMVKVYLKCYTYVHLEILLKVQKG